jgi:geranylgeranyl diphosphate synthase type II
MFQISDDILDVEGSLGDIGKTPGKDEKENKMTSIKVLGLDGAKEFNDKLFSDTIRILDQIPNTEFLKNLIESLYNRKK